MWELIRDHGNRIGWHTYTMLEDPPGSNEQAILHDLAHLNIRSWIDHAVPFNPEDIAYNGLFPDSLQYVGDVINQSNIDYIWPAKPRPPTLSTPTKRPGACPTSSTKPNPSPNRSGSLAAPDARFGNITATTTHSA
jgi:hypothetical protein